jgi:hypothetical protein
MSLTGAQLIKAYEDAQKERSSLMVTLKEHNFDIEDDRKVLERIKKSIARHEMLIKEVMKSIDDQTKIMRQHEEQYYDAIEIRKSILDAQEELQKLKKKQRRIDAKH